jgi:hypothetical protein
MNRLLRIEARRSALLPLLPLCLALMYLTPIFQHLEPVALWTDRSTDLQSAVQMIGPFSAATAAWTASRERRRTMDDLLASTPCDQWRRWLASWAGTCGWAVLFYAAVGAVLFSLTAVQATWGDPVVWPVLSGLTALIACTTIGFAAGRLVPSRITTPLTGVGVFFAMTVGMGSAVHGGAFGRLSPLYPSIGLESSVFYAIRPDLTYVQAGCYLGLTTVAFGLVTLHDHAGGRRLLLVGTAVTMCGLALVASAVWLVSTSHRDHQGVIVPMLHDSGTDRTIPYTPVCTHSPFPVCLHPAYAAANERTTFDTTINKIAAPLLGTPGLPVRADQIPGTDKGSPASTVEGDPPVLLLPDLIIHGHTLEPAGFARAFRTRIALALVMKASTTPCHCAKETPAQRAVALYLLDQAGYRPDTHLIPREEAVTNAAQHLAAMPTTVRTAWFMRHIAAVRAGTLTITELP